MENILLNEYNLIIKELIVLPGGYFNDETFLLTTNYQVKYVVKFIKYRFTFEDLQSILEFQNILHDLHDYPCSKIIPSKNGKILCCVNGRFLFVQTFIEGIEPTEERDESYFYQMGSLLAKWRNVSENHLINSMTNEEFTEKWWKEQQMDEIDPFLRLNLIQCQHSLKDFQGNLVRGLIHNDFHPNNSLINKDQKISLVDFIDGCQSYLLADLATSLFHLLVNQDHGKHRAKFFLQGYQETQRLKPDEIDILDVLVRLKLSLSIIEDLRHCDMNNSFIQSCFYLLHSLHDHPTFIKDFLTY